MKSLVFKVLAIAITSFTFTSCYHTTGLEQNLEGEFVAKSRNGYSSYLEIRENNTYLNKVLKHEKVLYVDSGKYLLIKEYPATISLSALYSKFSQQDSLTAEFLDGFLEIEKNYFGSYRLVISYDKDYYFYEK